eukprot:symbB.v1.2.017114.t1/scaffold1276.1/size127259/5
MLVVSTCPLVEPNHFSSSSAISSSPWQYAIDILEATRSKSVVCFVGALATCCNTSAWVAALCCLQDMLDSTIDPGPVEVGTLAAELQRVEGRDEAWRLLQSMAETIWKDDRPPPDLTRPAQQLRTEILNLRGPILMANKPEGASTKQYAASLSSRLGTTLTLTSRLDFPTSGVLPLAAGESMAGKWIQAQLAARLVDKEYLCLCEGVSLGSVSTTGVVAAKLLTIELEGTSRSEVNPQGREARTEYKVLQRFSLPEVYRERRGPVTEKQSPPADSRADSDELMLLSAHPITGRTHQIRVHFAFLGRPLVGDLTYGRRESSVACPRLFDHGAAGEHIRATKAEVTLAIPHHPA